MSDLIPFAARAAIARHYGINDSHVVVSVVLDRLHPEILRDLAARYSAPVTSSRLSDGRYFDQASWDAAGGRVSAVSVEYSAPTAQEVEERHGTVAMPTQWSPKGETETDVEALMFDGMQAGR